MSKKPLRVYRAGPYTWTQLKDLPQPGSGWVKLNAEVRAALLANAVDQEEVEEFIQSFEDDRYDVYFRQADVDKDFMQCTDCVHVYYRPEPVREKDGNYYNGPKELRVDFTIQPGVYLVEHWTEDDYAKKHVAKCVNRKSHVHG